MKFSLVAMAVGFVLAGADSAKAYTPPGTATAQYEVSTGNIYVEVNGVINWYVESTSAGLTGDEPMGLPTSSGLITNNDSRIGESALSPFSFSNLNLGRVAAPNLPVADLTINWNTGLGEPLQTVNIGPDPPFEFARINGPFVVDLATDPLNITLDASESTLSGPRLDFSWDIDGLPGYEIFTDETPTLDIDDVTATFGGVGVYEVRVGVGFFEGFDDATTTVTIINSVPEPTALVATCLGLCVLISTRCRSCFR